MKQLSKKTFMCLFCILSFAFQALLPISAASGIEIFDATYDYIRPFDGDFASVYRDGEYAIIRKDNAVFYTSDADGFGNYREGMISFYENGSTKIAQLNGDTLNLPGFQFAGDYHGAKCAVVNAQKKFGMIDTQGNFLLECQFEDILYNESDTVCIKQNGIWRTVTLNPFSPVARTSYRLADPVYSSTGRHILASNGNGYGILSTDQVPLTEFKYDLIRDASEGVFVAYYGDFVDLIGEDGKILSTFKADFVGSCSGGVLPCHDDSGFRYINLAGATVLVPQIKGLSYIDSFYDSYAVVKNSSGYTYINTTGQQAVRNIWDYADRFADGYALVMNYRLDEDTRTMEQQWHIIDTEFNVVENLPDDVYYDSTDVSSTNFSKGYVRTINRDTNLMGFIRLASPTGSDTPQNIPVIGVTVNPTEKVLTSLGETFTVIASILPQIATNKAVSYSSTNPAVASVDPVTGMVTAVANGTASVIVTTADGGKTAVCTVNVDVHTHVMQKIKGVSATCTQTGILEHWHCDVCEKNYSDQAGAVLLTTVQIPVDLNNHIGETEIRGQVDATSKHEGYTGDEYCLACGNLITAGTSIEKLPAGPSDYWLEVLVYLYNQKFPVTAIAGEGGTVSSPGVNIVQYNQNITFTFIPNEGYIVDNVYINGEAQGSLAEYTFKKVQAEQTIEVTFKKTGWDNPFGDIKADDWFYADVEYVFENELMQGTGAQMFSPDTKVNRAMIVTILWRLEGEPVVESPVDFFDVTEKQWYTDAIGWASANGIVNGYGNGMFGPADKITREQVAAILHRYANYKGLDRADEAATAAKYSFTTWAEKDVAWAESNGILTGLDVSVNDMTAEVSRAEMAAYLRRFCTKLMK